MDDDRHGTSVRFDREWFRFGLVVGILYAAFTLVVIYLLRFDQTIGLVAAAGAGVVFGVTLMVYLVYAKGVDVSLPG